MTVVLGDVVNRPVDFGLGDTDPVLVGFLKLDHFVFEGAQDLGADLRQIFLRRPHAEVATKSAVRWSRS